MKFHSFLQSGIEIFTSMMHDAHVLSLRVGPICGPTFIWYLTSVNSSGKHWELKASVEYSSGCWRSHTALLKFPVIDPFLLEISQATLGNGTVLITSTITSCLPNCAVLEDMVMSLKETSEDLLKLSPLGAHFPCSLQPAESLSVVYSLSKAQGTL